MKIGIIAEDDSDVDVLREVTLILLKPHKIGFKKFVGHGCGRLRKKCGAWAKNLVEQGCPYIVVVHDNDAYDEQKLRSNIKKEIGPAKASDSVILIPKEEIEAWLMYDAKAIATAFKQNTLLKLPSNPEDVPDPKGCLGKLIEKKYERNYLHTVHNAEIAKHIRVSQLAKAVSFAPHPLFTARIGAMR